jgi:predicted AAA+ superfamily ATPase
MEMPDIRAAVEDDPRAFLSNYTNGLVIDEVQYVPELFSYLQGFADESKEMGKYILTGSQNFLLLRKISQSLAGRVAILNLLPLSYEELKASGIVIGSYIDFLFTGGYPSLYDRQIAPTDYFPPYIQSYLERDVRSIINVTNLSTFRKFLGIVAGRTGQLLNANSIANDIGVDQKTVKSWLSVLETGFIIFFARAYHKNYNKRLIKSPKLYFYDTGLACSLLGLRSPDELQNHFMKGALFENYVFSEIAKHYFNNGMRKDLYFWRNNTGNEIDCIIEAEGKQKAIEIKSGTTLNRDFFKGLTYYRKLSGLTENNLYLIYGGTEKLKQNNGIVLPWNAISELFQ